MIKQKAIKGVKWTSISSIFISILQFIKLIILTRYLEPTAFGLMAIVMVFIGFSKLFMDFGITNGIIFKQDITHNQLSTLYWFNILVSVFLTLIISLFSPLIASLYHEPLLQELIILVSLTFILTSFGNQFRILYEKRLDFQKIAQVDIFSNIVSFISTILFAMNDYGVYSLVYGQIIYTAVSSLLYIISGLRFHKPKLYFNFKEISFFIKFGVYDMAKMTVGYFTTQLDTLIIGKIFGTEILGIYNIAKQIVMKPAQVINPIINKVAFPIIAKIQNETEKVKNLFLKIINYIATINFLIYTIIFINASELVLLFLGNKWIETIPLIQILSIYVALRSIGNPIGPLMIGKGRVKLAFYWNLWLLIYYSAGMYIASFFTIRGFAWGLVILMAVSMLPGWYFLVRPLSGVKFFEYFKNIFKPLVVSLVIGSIGFNVISLFDNNIVKLVVNIFIIIIGGIILNYIYNKTIITDIKEIIK